MFSTPAIFARRISVGIQWLVPATACLLLTVALFNQNNGLIGAPSHGDSMMLVSSNLTPQTFAGGVFHQSNRNQPADRIEWTNGGAFTSSVGSFLPDRVN
ncbi:MAG TPA: hypothetical protein VK327_06970 [Candidatus Paceibacterota bacterium]|nr:hypothetical protein [Candidatus Paceibacterota bacterium]